MKKLIKVGTAALVALSVARVDAAVTWFDTSTQGSSTVIFTGLTGDTPLPVGSVYQIVWSADAVYSSGSVFDAGDYTSNGDTLLYQGTSDDWLSAIFQVPPYSSGGGMNADGDSTTTYTVPNGGFVYGRVFNTTGPLTTPGITFGQTAIAPVTANATNNPVPDLQQQIQWGTINASYDDNVTGSDTFDGQVSLDASLSQGSSGYQGAGVWSTVPEPGTFAFIGIGALMLGLRRKFARS